MITEFPTFTGKGIKRGVKCAFVVPVFCNVGCQKVPVYPALPGM